MVMNQDGSIQVQVGETEIGQGADTAFAQMAAETLGIPFDMVHVMTVQDTDVTPFGLGAYASRQTYMAGFSIRQTAELLKSHVLDTAVEMTRQMKENLDIIDGNIVRATDGSVLMSLGELATEKLYSLTNCGHLTAESTYQIKNNAYSFGCTFAEVEVDISGCRATLTNIVNVHDCGRLINPALAEAGLSQSMGSMEGKEVRFGVAQSALFTTVTTSFTTGTINNMHDTLTPLGGLVPLLHMMLNCVFGGKGVGLMNMVMYVILAVFISGLMIGRTPECREMKLTALAIIIHPLLILAFSALAVATSAGQAGITNPGFHGLTQVLYEYASSAANNGSGFEGLADNTYFWNITTGLVMFLGRYLPIVLQLAIAGSLMKKSYVNESAGTLQTSTVSFSVILVFVVYIFAALTFFPALALGPIAEHLTLWG